ncbi:hypothetical protein M3650_06245 [Paenibacillus sp. MER TA 81-3]|nr:hypothetical protein [Paenibacillus sp. MER TA 81-3]
MLVIVIGIIHVLVLEGAGLHFLIHQWSALAAWILTLSNVYFILALIADYRLMKLNPVLVTDRDVRIRFGMKRQMKQIALCLDKPHDFVAEVMGERE